MKQIRVAILAEEPMGWGSGRDYFPAILNNYNWKINDNQYAIKAEYLFDRDIIKGKLKVSNFDVLLVPGGGVGDGESIVRGIPFLYSTRKWKKNIQNFIKNGGGYVGICGGTALLTGLTKGKEKLKSITEKLYDRSSVNISCVNSYYKDLAFPIFYPFQKNHPEKIGATGYVFSFAPGETEDGKKFYSGGIPLDFQIFKNNPIFSDLTKDTERIRWWGGPALVVPKNPDRKVKIIAKYPELEISKNKQTRVYAWSYEGGIIGLLKSLFDAFKLIKKEKEPLKNLFLFAYYLAGNWKKSDKTINLNFSNKASITAEVYPNENEGRILLCTSHPEYMIWWGGKIEPVDNNQFNCLAKGLHKWKDVRSLTKNGEIEFTYTWWIVRRFVAWAAKIPDEDMPPMTDNKINSEGKKILESLFYKDDIIDQMKNI